MGVTPEVHPELDGAWFRAFDFGKWDYWSSDNDWGYGPWVTDSGWTNGWIATGLAMRAANTTLWDIMNLVDFPEDTVSQICGEMLGQDLSPVYCTVKSHKNDYSDHQQLKNTSTLTTVEENAVFYV